MTTVVEYLYGCPKCSRTERSTKENLECCNCGIPMTIWYWYNEEVMN